jgi:Pvc16 N-terminal domain
MSNARAIAAATATLRHLLLTQVPLIDTDLSDLEVTTQPLDLARKNITKAQLNLFLYQAVVSAAWRNHDLPAQVRPGETGNPPLALDLHYLLTAWGRGDSDNDSVSHRVLGCAMSLLGDHPVLGSAEIAAAMANNDLGDQIERVRIRTQPMGIEDMSKLWTIFQSQYRLSVAYEVGIVLIDSRRPARAPLPVINRGPADRGPVAVAGGAPTLKGLRLPRLQSAIRLGEEAILTGSNLSAADTEAVVIGAPATDEIVLPVFATGEPDELALHIPDVAEDPAALSRWRPGHYLVALTQSRPDVPPVSSNSVALTLAPRITVAPLAAAQGDLVLTLSCEPRIRSGQRVLLIFGDQHIKPDTVDSPADTSQPTALQFTVPQVTAGDHLVRLRVDGVDSIPAAYAGTPPVASFDAAQMVKVP